MPIFIFIFINWILCLILRSNYLLGYIGINVYIKFCLIIQSFFCFGSVTVTVAFLNVLIKILKNGDFDMEAHLLSFLWGRSRTRRTQSRQSLIQLFCDYLCGTHLPIIRKLNWILRSLVDCWGFCSRSSSESESFTTIDLPGRSLPLKSKSQ